MKAKQKSERIKAKPMRVKQKHPSGYAGRMTRRKKLAEKYGVNAKMIALPNEVLAMPYVGKLKTVSNWHTQVARIYRRMLSGQIPEYVGTKLVYVCTAGAQLARMLQELREIEGLRKQLEELQQNGGLINRPAVDFLPASDGDHEHRINGD